MIIACTGVEGGGKSASLAHMTQIHVAGGGHAVCFPTFNVYLPVGKNGDKKLITKVVKTENWVTIDERFAGYMVDVDEIQNFFGAESWNALTNRIFGKIAMQRRKLGLVIGYTVQNPMWVDNRLRWLTHITVSCQDLRYSDWGIEQKIPRGKLTLMTFWDNKGFFTGKEGGLIGTRTLKTDRMYDYFESFYPVDIFEGMSKVSVLKKEVEIDARAKYNPMTQDGIQINPITGEVTGGIPAQFMNMPDDAFNAIGVEGGMN